MQNNWMNIDLKNMVDTLRENIRNLGGFNPEQVRQAGLLNEEGFRSAIVKALFDGPKTGAAIIEAISEKSASNFKPAAGTIYPLLEQLSDEGLVSSSIKKDRKLFSLTEAGKEFHGTLPSSQGEPAEANTSSWSTPKWVDLRGVVPIAATRLGKVSVEVATYGTKEQQEAAAAAIDEARRRIHEILAAE
jgi:DNA-binding PadR family transcriptional regulator